MDRSTLTRNAIRNFARNRVSELQNESNDGDGHNSLDESIHLDTDINLNVLDFIPNEQYNVSFKHLPRIKAAESNLTKKKLFILITLMVFLIASAAYGYMSLKNANTLESSRTFTLGKNCNFAQHNIFTKIAFLNQKLRSLSTTLAEVIEWRNQMKMDEIKNGRLQENYKFLEKVNLKIENALNLYDADKVGMIDYALESAGGFITSIPDTVPFPDKFSYDILGLISVQYNSNPRILIQPGTLPGQCFAFEGHNGRVRIRLADVVDVIAVTIEHAHPSLVTDMTSAPKDFKVYGLESQESENGDDLGSFKYRIDRKPLQTFEVMKLNKGNMNYQHVELHILTNHGNPNYTCVYRFRVHGSK